MGIDVQESDDETSFYYEEYYYDDPALSHVSQFMKKSFYIQLPLNMCLNVNQESTRATRSTIYVT